MPPVHYFAKLQAASVVYLEAQENYVKGSYRNRCHIGAVNGVQRLSIPLMKGKNNQMSIRDVHIAYYEPWKGRHWNAIKSAYGNSPYFKFYQDDLRPFFIHKSYEYIWDFNFDLLLYFIHIMGVHTEVRLTDTFERNPPKDIIDLRNKIHPKKEFDDPEFVPLHYPQVFEDRHGFQPNLSIIDLLLCCGRSSKGILRRCVQEPAKH